VGVRAAEVADALITIEHSTPDWNGCTLGSMQSRKITEFENTDEAIAYLQNP